MKQKSFTLIELLVVIAIIGLLASIVLVSLRSARGKASIAGGLQFSQNIFNTLGDEAVGIWELDEGVDDTCSDGRDICDVSGRNHHGNRNTAIWRCASSDPKYTVTGKGCSLEFDGNNYADIPDSSDFDISSNGFTYEAWIKANTDFSRSFNIFMGHNVPYFSVRSTKKIQFVIVIVGLYQGATGNTDVSINTWHHVVGTYNNNGMIRVYLDGKLDGEAGPYLGTLQQSNDPFYIGNLRNISGYGFPGLIDVVRVYNQTLTAGEVQKLYVEGLKEHSLASSE